MEGEATLALLISELLRGLLHLLDDGDSERTIRFALSALNALRGMVWKRFVVLTHGLGNLILCNSQVVVFIHACYFDAYGAGGQCPQYMQCPSQLNFSMPAMTEA